VKPLLGLVTACLALLAPTARGAEPPVIPIGLDAYRMWDKWPQQRMGARAYMRSTYDRTGGNRGPDASHFLYQLADDRNVTLDVQGRASCTSSTAPSTSSARRAPPTRTGRRRTPFSSPNRRSRTR
jgi:hypothetical protein